jgi:hypothetical protein
VNVDLLFNMATAAAFQMLTPSGLDGAALGVICSGTPVP